MIKFGTIIALTIAISAFTVHADVVFTMEKPRVQETTFDLAWSKLVNFDDVNSEKEVFHIPFTDYTTGTYKSFAVRPSDDFGGAQGNKYYLSAKFTEGSTIVLTKKFNYFGYWHSALDRYNRLEMFSDGKKIFELNAETITQRIANLDERDEYYGNPTSDEKENIKEIYVFINILCQDCEYDTIVFSQTKMSRNSFESDNHTVGLLRSSPTTEPKVPKQKRGLSEVAMGAIIGSSTATLLGSTIVGFGLYRKFKKSRKGNSEVPIVQTTPQLVEEKIQFAETGSEVLEDREQIAETEEV